jgi:hypothetical protein
MFQSRVDYLRQFHCEILILNLSDYGSLASLDVMVRYKQIILGSLISFVSCSSTFLVITKQFDCLIGRRFWSHRAINSFWQEDLDQRLPQRKVGVFNCPYAGG